MVRAAAIVVGVVLLLTGCTTTPVPPEMTEAELLAYRTEMADEAWVSISNVLDERPDVEFVRFVTEDDAWEALMECLPDYGVEVIDADEESRSYSWNGIDQDVFALASYSCGVAYPYRPEEVGYFTPDQRDYLYDYYRTFLVPCLTFNDFEVVDVPTREQFLADRPWWSPYLNQDDPLTGIDAQRLFPLCPPDPFDARVTVVP